MFPRKGERAIQFPEPTPLGVAVDPESAALYEEFAEHRSYDQLYALWQDPQVTNPTIRQRALAALTAPSGYKLQYSHTTESIGRLLNIEEEIDGKRTDSLQQRLAGRPELAEELAAAIVYWLDTTGGRIAGTIHDSRHNYQRAIQGLLPIVSETTADNLFARYPANDNDVQPSGNINTAASFQSLISLLYIRDLPIKYKDIILAQWFVAAEQEEQDPAYSSDGYERTIKQNMARFVERWTNGDAIDDSTNTAVVTFLEDHTPEDCSYVMGIFVRQITDQITDENVRFNFAWRHLINGSLRDGIDFSIEDDRDLNLVQWIRSEAHKRNLPQFDEKADSLMQKYEVKRQKQAATQAAELALYARLRS